MNISHINSLPQITSFLQEHKKSSFKVCPSKLELYEWMRKLLIKLKYQKLKKKEKSLVKKFLKKVTGYSKKQIKRLIQKYKQGKLFWRKWQKGEGRRTYSHQDIGLLHEADKAHLVLSGKATKHILWREFYIYKKKEFERLANISASHIYNLRGRVSYQRLGKLFTKTKSRTVNIGERRKPDPQGKPGYVRVDTVHQGDQGKQKGVYYINVVDEVTQWEFVFCVKSISEKYLAGVLQALDRLCPYIIINFHSDNGSEYINKKVANILNRLHIGQTKSRPRKSNDNALAETKNGSIIRKHFGYFHIPATEHNAHVLNIFCINYLNSYLNYHRPCGFVTITVDHKGKEKRKYNTYLTPYEKFKTIDKAEQYLKPGMSFEQLDEIAHQMSDTEFARLMNEKKAEAFQKLKLKKYLADQGAEDRLET